MSPFTIGTQLIGSQNDKTYIIAEIGQNHQGDIDKAKQMIAKAKEIGCDCVKFQKSCLEAKFTASALNRKYDGENSWGKTYGEHKRYLEFTMEQYRELKEFSRENQIDFTASAMDTVSLMALNQLNVPFIKIGSGDANNFAMLKEAALLSCPLVLSTGMQTIDTVNKIVQIMNNAGKSNYALLHCISAYPTEPKDCRLQLLQKLKTKYPDIVIGYSGHEEGIEISKAAVLMGAKIIERHFTLDKLQKGSDHKCSLTPDEFHKLVNDIRLIERSELHQNIPLTVEQVLEILGTNKDVQLALIAKDEKKIFPCELSCKNKLGKSLVTAITLKRDHVIQGDDVCIKVSEPNGIPAEHHDSILGRKLNCDLAEDNPIKYENLFNKI